MIAAGAPWSMAVFGRDSLIAGVDEPAHRSEPGAQGGRDAGSVPGHRCRPATEEEPGRILHEMRFGAATGLALGGGQIYYGTIDATPLFVLQRTRSTS